MKKTKLLVVNSVGGVDKYRITDPHVFIQNKYPETYHIDIINDFKYDNDTLKKYDCIVIHSHPNKNDTETSFDIFNRIKKLGMKVIIDIDDYWYLPKTHPMYYVNTISQSHKIIEYCIKNADIVTTTTKNLMEKILPLNKNVFVIPNGVNPNEPQFKPNPTKSDLIRFGWLGGSSHLTDISLLGGISNEQPNFTKKTQIVLCGFDIRDRTVEINPTTGESKIINTPPNQTQYALYEYILTNNYYNLNKDEKYINYLKQYFYDPNYNDYDKIYRRIWTKPITSYANGYNEFDISLIPLVENTFNYCKSELKIIEAGFHKKAIIVQNYGPYDCGLTNIIGKNNIINNKGNAILIDYDKNNKNWVKYVKKLLNNSELIDDLSNNLYEFVKDKYDINTITELRHQIYQTI